MLCNSSVFLYPSQQKQKQSMVYNLVHYLHFEINIKDMKGIFKNTFLENIQFSVGNYYFRYYIILHSFYITLFVIYLHFVWLLNFMPCCVKTLPKSTRVKHFTPKASSINNVTQKLQIFNIPLNCVTRGNAELRHTVRNKMAHRSALVKRSIFKGIQPSY